MKDLIRLDEFAMLALSIYLFSHLSFAWWRLDIPVWTECRDMD